MSPRLQSRARPIRTPASLSSVLLVGLVLAACGDDDDTTATTAAPPAATTAPADDAEFPVSVLTGEMGADTSITLEAEPSSIVSLSPTATEMLWAVGAGDQVVAVDDQSDYPEDVPVTELSGLRAQRGGDPRARSPTWYWPSRTTAATWWRASRRRRRSRPHAPVGHRPRRVLRRRSSGSAPPPATRGRPPSWSRRCRADIEEAWPTPRTPRAHLLPRGRHPTSTLPAAPRSSARSTGSSG